MTWFLAAAGFAGPLLRVILSPESFRGRRIPRSYGWVSKRDGKPGLATYGGCVAASTLLGMSAEKVVLALSTFPDRETAWRICNQLVTEKFVACGNVLPAVESIYRWKEKIESGNETLVLFKLSENRQSAFQEKLRSLHPYEVPEIIFVPVLSGLPEYLYWVTENCG